MAMDQNQMTNLLQRLGDVMQHPRSVPPTQGIGSTNYPPGVEQPPGMLTAQPQSQLPGRQPMGIPQQPPEGLTKNHAHQTINLLLVYMSQVLQQPQMPLYQKLNAMEKITQSVSSLVQLTQEDGTEAKAAELQMKQQLEQQKLQLQQQLEEQRMLFEEYKMEQELALAKMKADAEQELAQAKLQMEQIAQVQKLEQQDSQHQQNLQHQAEQHQQKMSQASESHETTQQQAKTSSSE